MSKDNKTQTDVYLAQKRVPKLDKPVAQLGLAAYGPRPGSIFIDEMPHPREAITGSFYGGHTVSTDQLREYALALLELADIVDDANGDEYEPSIQVEVRKFDAIWTKLNQLSEAPFTTKSELIAIEDALQELQHLGMFQRAALEAERNLEWAYELLERIRDNVLVIDEDEQGS